MNIEKRHWKWNEELNSTEYKLRDRIDELLAKGLVSKCEEQDEYTGIDGFPWRIQVVGERIVSIFFRNEFFPLVGMDIWDLELEDFERALNSILQPSVEEEECDKLVVTFREFFVTVVEISAYKKRDK